MASLILCPHCGHRPKEEYSIRGDASLTRPAPDASAAEWHDYVHIRKNPRGRYKEFWHHTSGCRRWLVVERDTFTHNVYNVVDVSHTQTGEAP